MRLLVLLAIVACERADSVPPPPPPTPRPPPTPVPMPKPVPGDAAVTTGCKNAVLEIHPVGVWIGTRDRDESHATAPAIRCFSPGTPDSVPSSQITAELWAIHSEIDGRACGSDRQVWLVAEPTMQYAQVVEVMAAARKGGGTAIAFSSAVARIQKGSYRDCGASP